MDDIEALRKQLITTLEGKGAHAAFDEAVADFPAKLRGIRPEGLPHSGWELLEHIRLAQWDILEFSRNAKYTSPGWPEGYWPKSPAPPDDLSWDQSVKQYHADLASMGKLVADPKNNLFARIPHGSGQTLLREALLIADHTAYHLGQLVLVRRLLGAWKAS